MFEVENPMYIIPKMLYLIYVFVKYKSKIFGHPHYMLYVWVPFHVAIIIDPFQPFVW